MPTLYGVNVTMDGTTAQKLFDGGFHLYAFKSVQASSSAGAPMVWFQTRGYSQLTEIQWEEKYQAYSSKTSIAAGVSIGASSTVDIELGQTFVIEADTGFGKVITTGTPGAITIQNDTQTEFSNGIAQSVGKDVSKLCVFPLYGQSSNLMTPVQKVLLMFATQPVNTGTVIFQAFSSGVLIDLTGVTSRTVNYQINQGWSWDGGVWARTTESDANLRTLLIE